MKYVDIYMIFPYYYVYMHAKHLIHDVYHLIILIFELKYQAYQVLFYK